MKAMRDKTTVKLRLAILLLASSFVACSPATPTVNPPDTVQPSPTHALFDDTPLPPPPTAFTDPTAPSPSPEATTKPTSAPSQIPLTQGQCCGQPVWAGDSQRVLFLDKPDATAQTGIYAVDIDSPGVVKLLTSRVAYYTGDFKYAIYFRGAFTVVESVDDGQKWEFRTGGRNVSLAPDRTRVVWNETPETYPFENRLTNVMLGSLVRPAGRTQTAGEAHRVVSVLRGGASAWLDDQHLLMTGREAPDSQEVTLFVYSLADGTRHDLVRARNLRSITPSPGGEWIAYAIVFDKQPERDGLWLAPTNDSSTPTGSSVPRKLGFFGAFQWRDAQRLVYVPLEPGVASQVLYEYDVASNRTRQLTDPARTPFKIANGDWAISPDGNKIVFVNSQDMNLWLLKIP